MGTKKIVTCIIEEIVTKAESSRAEEKSPLEKEARSGKQTSNSKESTFPPVSSRDTLHPSTSPSELSRSLHPYHSRLSLPDVLRALFSALVPVELEHLLPIQQRIRPLNHLLLESIDLFGARVQGGPRRGAGEAATAEGGLGDGELVRDEGEEVGLELGEREGEGRGAVCIAGRKKFQSGRKKEGGPGRGAWVRVLTWSTRPRTGKRGTRRGACPLRRLPDRG